MGIGKGRKGWGKEMFFEKKEEIDLNFELKVEREKEKRIVQWKFYKNKRKQRLVRK